MGRILEIRDLRTYFDTERGTVKALDGVNLDLDEGDTLGIVGESGCGKTMLALSILRLVPTPPGRIVSGSVIFAENDLIRLREDEMRRIRGRDISMIFQEPMTSLNPVFRVGEQIAETMMLHLGLKRKEALECAVDMLKLVGMPAPDVRIRDYPHQMSGGMRQRVMIAMAMSCSPKLLLADEPTTALDVTIQAQILDLIVKMKEKTGTAVILITHDLGVVAEAARRVAVMYAGKIVEYGPVESIFRIPLHPYTLGLMASIPRMTEGGPVKKKLTVIPGTVPSLNNLPAGCRFEDRCAFRMDICSRQEPPLKPRRPGHSVSCWFIGNGG
jgi:oligopeptide/dipeptide ABC transporter ATP-binding protein